MYFTRLKTDTFSLNTKSLMVFKNIKITVLSYYLLYIIYYS